MVVYKKWLVIGLLLSVTACSGGGDQQSTDEAVGNNAKEEGDIPENGSLTNNKGGNKNDGNISDDEGGGNAANNAGGNNAGGNAGNSEQINNAEGENFGGNGKNGGNQFANNNKAGGGNNFLAEDAGAGGEGINNATASEDSVDGGLGGGGLNAPANPAVDAPATDASVNPVVDQAAAGGDVDPASTETAPSVTAGPTGPTGPMVKYVPGTGADIFKDSPGTEVVGKFNQGDHPLVYENGEWARLSDGHYVQNSALSVTPVPRPKRPAVWQ